MRLPSVRESIREMSIGLGYPGKNGFKGHPSVFVFVQNRVWPCVGFVRLGILSRRSIPELPNSVQDKASERRFACIQKLLVRSTTEN